MSTRFKPGDKVKVCRVVPENPGERTYGSTYPLLGWTGKLGRLFSDYGAEWAIKWDKKCKPAVGDLVREWMIEGSNVWKGKAK